MATDGGPSRPSSEVDQEYGDAKSESLLLANLILILSRIYPVFTGREFHSLNNHVVLKCLHRTQKQRTGQM